MVQCLVEGTVEPVALRHENDGIAAGHQGAVYVLQGLLIVFYVLYDIEADNCVKAIFQSVDSRCIFYVELAYGDPIGLAEPSFEKLQISLAV